MIRPDLRRAGAWIIVASAVVLWLMWRDRTQPAAVRPSAGANPTPWLADSGIASDFLTVDTAAGHRFSIPRPFSRIRAPTLVRERVAVRIPKSLRAAEGERIRVSATAYCLDGFTRTGRPVRAGIVAADPRVFPLGRDIALEIGGRPLGTFRVDDTGLLIKGRIVDIWLEDCRAARRFGRQRGVAVLLPRTPATVSDSGPPLL